MDRRRALRVIALLVGLTIGLGMMLAPRLGLAAEPLIKVRLAAFRSSFVNFPIYVATDLGLFKKHGLDVEIIFGTGAQVTNAVVSGATEFGGFGVENGMAVVAKGQDLRYIVLNQTATPFTLIVRNAVPLPNRDKGYPASLTDLKGLKLGVSTPGASSDNTLRYLLRQAGLDPDKDVKIIPVGNPDTQLAALAHGQIDGTIAFEPIQSAAVFGLKIAKPILDLQAGEGPDLFRVYAYNGIAARGEYLAKNREVGRRMVAAIVEAEEFINDPAKIDAAVDSAVRNMQGISRDVLDQFLRKYRHIFRPVMTREALDNVNRVLLDSKRITEPVPWEKTVDADLMPKTFKYGL